MRLKIAGTEDWITRREAEILVQNGDAIIARIGERLEVRTTEEYERKFYRWQRRQKSETRRFDRAVAESCSTRVWKSRHSGNRPMVDAPRAKVRQFVEIAPRGITSR